jgi:hypothetical protein
MAGLFVKSIPLGYAPLDVVHAQFDAVLRAAKECEEGRLLATLRKVQEHMLADVQEAIRRSSGRHACAYVARNGGPDGG